MSLRRIDLADIPESARVDKSTLPGNHASTSKPLKKRTADQAGLGKASLATNPTRAASTSFPSLTQEDIEEEVVDELYCNLTTSVVGIQYYQGRNHPFPNKI